MRIWIPAAAFVMYLTACGGADCPEGTYPDGDGCALIPGESDNSGDDDDDDDDGDDDDDDDNNDDGGAVGDVCSYDSDCSSNFCVFESGDDSYGVCTETCSSWSDCSESFWSCCDIYNGGSACIPDDWVERNPDVQCD